MKKLLIPTMMLSFMLPVVHGKTANLLLSKDPIEVSSMYNTEKMLDLEKTRKLCHYLTDVDILKTQTNYTFPKRRKAYRRHIKQVCEQLELTSWMETPLADDHRNMLYEINLFKKSMENRAYEEAVGMTFMDRVRMGLTSLLRKNKFSFSKKVTRSEAMNLNLNKKYTEHSVEELSQIDPIDSPYYQSNKDNLPLYKRFGALAKSKKINPKKDDMVVIFDGESTSGSAPKIKTLDTNLDDKWSLKWGDELHTDVVGSRIFAGLGFDVDHPYYRKKNSIILVFPKNIPGQSQNAQEMIQKIKGTFKVDIDNFINKTGVVDAAMVRENDELAPYIGLNYVTFVECAIEGRPDRVKRLGAMMTNSLFNRNRRELRGSLLAHLWIDNWDTRHANTMMALNHQGNRVYHASGVFSDLGTSLGVKVNYLPTDFRVGLVNDFGWNIVKSNSKNRLRLYGQMNSILKPYESATYSDLRWMALKIAQFTEKDLEKILDKSGWPKGIAKLYFYKLANRRAQILEAFNITDPNPIEIDRNYTYERDGVVYVKNGRLIRNYSLKKHPLGYLGTQGRMRNYGQSNGGAK